MVVAREIVPDEQARIETSLRTFIADENIDVVISTGAMPGLLLLFCGWLTGAKTIWIDSFANPERMTMSGAYAKRFATHCLVQWEDLAKAEGVSYRGRVL